ncbi:MAG: 50S ribosomal protein L34 [Candidatus Andersenbacteria bacterium CG10_big_fil_rev_8_21_14_0_10_54_11]|uniref:Large ribosomal subunit protein bL34 n=1 Tax=Candidatus Andersenbacteria bacterium CG10_big_fil_rev_8_21_14_0_10_54_11 TaxID=1974485 RepID=A0A2M6X085_9BACT|nr:MAG: 50S ribosomal protein L34 [Candidatus Andersenbacteria bacterium CG10_big_fil_rev_8_21_14_0_10_54_11]
MPKRTYQPSKRRRARKFGFLAAKQRKRRVNVVASRRKKGRQSLAPTA